MFSGFELIVIKSWALTGREQLQARLQDEGRAPRDKENMQREYDALGSIIDTVRGIQKEYVGVDADHQGHMLSVLEAYADYVKELLYTAEMSTEDYAEEYYQIGYMQGRLELGLVSRDDISVIDDWEDILKENN